MTAKLYAIAAEPVNVVDQLRRIADEIEAGVYGYARGAVLTLSADRLEVFGLGEADDTVAHYLLCCAAHKMQHPMLD